MNENGSLDEEISRLESEHIERAKIQLWQMIGATKLANQIASSLGSQTLRALGSIRDEQLYKAAGFETFDKFLDQHPESPMSYEAFRRRVNLLKGEGAETFDVLNSLNVPMSQRKLLAGQIEVTDSEIKVGDVTVKRDDESRILELITKLYGKTLENQRTIERGKKDVEKYKRQRDEAKASAALAHPEGTTLGQAFLISVGGNAQFLDAASEAPEEEREALRDSIFEHYKQLQLRLSEIYGFKPPRRSEVDDLDITDEQAAELMEEL